jgi:hypothetical protein
VLDGQSDPEHLPPADVEGRTGPARRCRLRGRASRGSPTRNWLVLEQIDARIAQIMQAIPPAGKSRDVS